LVQHIGETLQGQIPHRKVLGLLAGCGINAEATIREGDYALIWNCLSDGLEVRFVMTYVF